MAAAAPDAPNKDGPLGWLHYDVILASRTGYPLALMIGFTLYGNVLLRRESRGARYPSWIFGWPVGLICYTYAASFMSEIVFQGISPRCLANDNILFVYTIWFCLIQYCDRVYDFFLRKPIFVLITTWWLADATRVSLLTLERAVTTAPSIAKGVWQAWFWCAVAPLVRCLELAMRGEKIPKLSDIQPNTLNAFKYPLVSMFLIMLAYFFVLVNFTDCNILGKEGALTMTECGNKYQDIYAAFVYTACILHLVRGFWGLQEGKVYFGEAFCLPVGVPSRESLLPTKTPSKSSSQKEK
mmetsp:Transcript_60943/g.145228  ORF Transcript_60943/g.145228 Transcript_60943/m.145228 type:complete len:297 (-) Transcript_60943:111-1001(-)|eukprot:CAMPEP_0178443402 /NCGR_PEP_ID=MMETSP0689_2-20121128/38880_1 /TAXON_ID=160604 /ORGANISM="Amphidinium massartii, Strain CS-259" /LENGTH=296 /DNA_ID=CAMNT_0020067415 /DNA_START=100 /DNA_END=990 /DNA_ORIENTATION=-